MVLALVVHTNGLRMGIQLERVHQYQYPIPQVGVVALHPIHGEIIV